MDKEKLKGELTSTVYRLLMNEFEVLVWALWLDRNKFFGSPLPFETEITLIGLAVKLFLNENNVPIEMYMNHHYPALALLFNNWVIHN